MTSPKKPYDDAVTQGGTASMGVFKTLVMIKNRHLSVAIGILSLMTSFVYAGEDSPGSNPFMSVHEMRMGVLAHDVDDLWSGTQKEEGVDINGEAILNIFNHQTLNGTIRPNLGMTINTSGDTSKIYTGMVWERPLPYKLSIHLGIGLAVHDGELDTNDPDKKSLGSHVLFHIPIEVGYKLGPRYRVYLYFDHMSNAYLASPNEGMDTLGIRVGYRF